MSKVRGLFRLLWGTKRESDGKALNNREERAEGRRLAEEGRVEWRRGPGER